MEASMPARIIYDLIIQSLETNMRLAENLATFMQGVNGEVKQQDAKNGERKEETEWFSVVA